MKRAMVYFRRGKFFIHPWTRAQSGFWVAEGPVAVVSKEDSSGMVLAITNALRASREGVPDPDPDHILPELYAMAGAKGWSDFIRSARGIAVVESEAGITLVPHSRSSSQTDLLSPAGDLTVAREELGQAIERLFQL